MVFSMVDFDAGEIRRIAIDVVESVGLPSDVEVVVEIDETTPFGGSVTTIEGRRVILSVEGGAFEDAHFIRQLSEPATSMVLGRLLFRTRDRLDPAFGDPPPDTLLTLLQHTAWDTYAVGRYARLTGLDGREARRRYAFRLRHGFTDAADAKFDRLWRNDGLTWADIDSPVAISGDRGH
jgi:hypothetical protein